MRKSFIGKYALLALIAAGVPMLNSCKDYSGDIDNLQDQINGINSTLTSVQGAVSSVQSEISNGSVITSVTQTSDGVTITLSNGKSYTITNGTDGKDGQDGANGTNGTNGKDADVWTIGTDGYWYKNGTKTEYKAIGSDGAPGAAGAAGAEGKYYYPASDGYFHIMPGDTKTNIQWTATPGTPAAGGGVSVVYAGNYIEFSWEEDGATQTAKIYNGTQLSSLEFIPSVLNPKVDYPTSDDQIYAVDGSLFVPSTATSANYTMYWGINHGFNKSNIVALEYRLSPSDANVPATPVGSFINRDVKTRTLAPDDMTTLMNVESQATDLSNGVLTVNASYNQSASNWIATQGSEYDFVAYQLNVNADEGETATFTTDYIAPDPLPVAPRIVNKQVMGPTMPPMPVPFYDNVHPVLATNNVWQNNNYLVNWVSNGPNGPKLGLPGDGVAADGSVTGDANLDLYYVDLLPANGGVDLSKYVALYGYRSRYPYVNDREALIGWMGEEMPNNLGFDGISYVFSLPEEYLANDTQKTNQQYFVSLSGSTLYVSTAAGSTGSQAIGRTPVVRVDAYMTPNKGQNNNEPQLVASSYIKVMITPTEVTEEPMDELKFPLTTYNKVYGSLISYDDLTTVQNNTPYMVGLYTWQDFNNNIYGNQLVDLTADTFWNFYGNNRYEYTVTVSATRNNPLYSVSGFGTKTLNNIPYTQFTGYIDPTVVSKNLSVSKTFYANENYVLQTLSDDTTNQLANGILFTANQWDNNTTTTNIQFFADYDALTQLSYIGGEYDVTVTILSNNTNVKPDIVLYGTFSIENTFPGYQYNVNYFPYNWNPYSYGNAGNSTWYVSTKGKVVDGHWALQMNTMEAFEMQGATSAGNGQNVFDYYAEPINEVNYNVDPMVPLGLTYQHGTTPDGYALVSNSVYGSADQLIVLTEELEDATLTAPLQYVPTFYNGETWDWYFNVLFRNPFLPYATGTAKLYPNYVPGVQYVNVAQYVQVNDESGNPIVVWNSTSKKLELTQQFAINQYKLSTFTVEYGFDPENVQYQTFAGQLTNGSVFDFDADVTVDGNDYEGQGLGVITYWNNGATTVSQYDFPVLVTITFPGVSKVTVEVPFSVLTSGTPAANNGIVDNTTNN